MHDVNSYLSRVFCLGGKWQYAIASPTLHKQSMKQNRMHGGCIKSYHVLFQPTLHIGMQGETQVSAPILNKFISILISPHLCLLFIKFHPFSPYSFHFIINVNLTPPFILYEFRQQWTPTPSFITFHFIINPTPCRGFFGGGLVFSTLIIPCSAWLALLGANKIK